MEISTDILCRPPLCIPFRHIITALSFLTLCVIFKDLSLTGNLVKAGLLMPFPKVSSWNDSSWITKLARLLLVGGSA